MKHPYRTARPRAFWARAVSRSYDAAEVPRKGQPLLATGEAVMSAGSCFAANLVPFLERSGIRYVRTEQPHPSFRSTHVENWSYHKFSAAYGNIYTVRHLLQLVQRALGLFAPREDRWYEADTVIDPFRPGLAFRASSDREFDALTRQHLACVIEAIRSADVFVFTLGLTEGWISKLDGAVFPACPGTISGDYDPSIHQFHNFTVSEVIADLESAIALIHRIKRKLRFVLTVSPVPLVATATDEHVLAATIYSKSVLRVAAQEMTTRMPQVSYFPAYEIVTGPQAPLEFFEPDRRDVTKEAVDTVMAAFLANCDLGNSAVGTKRQVDEAPPVRRRPAETPPVIEKSDLTAGASAAIAAAECEEEMAGLG